MNTALKTLQQEFVSSLTQAKASTQLAASIAPTSITPHGRFSIYIRNMMGGLCDVLGHVYPAVKALVGETFFRQAMHAYIATYAPTSGNLDDYGGNLAEFLAVYDPVKALPYLPDVARFEWAHHQCYCADDAPRLDSEMLTGLSPEALAATRILFHPSVQPISSPYPLVDIWKMHQQDDPPTLDLGKGGVKMLMVRSVKHEILFVTLSAGEYAFFLSLKNGLPLAAAFDDAIEKDPAFDFLAAINKALVSDIFSRLT